MQSSERKHTVVVFASRVVLFAGFLASWQVLSGPILPPAILGSPLGIYHTLYRWATVGAPATSPQPLIVHIWATTYEALAGFGLAIPTGILAGVALGLNKYVKDVLDPFIYAVYSIPRISLAPLFVLWFGIYTPSKVVQAFITAFFIIFFSTYEGVTSTSPRLLNALRVMGASRTQIISKVVIPGAWPYVFLGLRTGWPFAIIGAVVGEFIASNAGLGFLILYSTDFDVINGVFAGIFLLAIITLATEYALRIVQTRVIKW